ncbi:cyanoexosortase B [Thermoleptolyngbya sichuanensis A183]|uniref:Cyanoexosortase B n=1 Tax=Thermoleptolyngbya sichuanensis A183 TaxID=2737172 RepID=A0A6M8BFG7_9CYAN|nr:cyanoexosortase B [Thermoleptolyngbya sichuanensis]QKD82990.1 cyanoexosortase B [Thermoleptolyngbya sichuanensis A183]
MHPRYSGSGIWRSPSRFRGWLLLGLLGLLYGPLLLHWAEGWLNKTISIEHEYYSCGLLGLPLAAWLGWQRQGDWETLPEQRMGWAHGLGLGLLLLGLRLYLHPVAEAVNLSLPLVLTGLCLWLKGAAGLRLMAFPLLLVALATPTAFPYLLTPYILPLQQLIAIAAGFMLLQMGMDVCVDQVYVYVNNQVVEIAPYCAGLKLLFTGLYAGLILLYAAEGWRFTRQSLRESRFKAALFLLGIVGLTAIANILRNTMLAYLHGTEQKLAFDWLHEGWGGDLYSALTLGGLLWVWRGVEWLGDRWQPAPVDQTPLAEGPRSEPLLPRR